MRAWGRFGSPARSRRRVAEVFAAHIDGARIPDWFPGVQTIEDVSGPLDRVGTTYRLRFTRYLAGRVRGRRRRSAAHARAAWDSRPLGSSGKATMRFFEAARGRTRIDFHATYEPAGRAARAPDRPASGGPRAGRSRACGARSTPLQTSSSAAKEGGRRARNRSRDDGDRDLRRLDARLPRLPGARAGRVAEHAPVLPLRPAPVRCLPRRARSDGRGAPARATSSDFLTGLAAGDGDAAAATATIQRKAACLRSFYRHLRREGMRESDPTAALSTPRKGQKLPHVLGRAEVQRLLDQPKGTEPIALRDRALLELMYACGLRASEAIDARASADRPATTGRARARGKGSKERIVPVGREAVRAVAAYLRRGRPALVGARDGAAPVRQLPRRRAHAPGPLQDRSAAMRSGGLADKMSPHTLRHTLRDAPARGRLRPALGAGDAGPRRRRDDPALHAPLEQHLKDAYFRAHPRAQSGRPEATGHRPSA